jgi:hypothetical protein
MNRLRRGVVAGAAVIGLVGVVSIAPPKADALACTGAGCNGKSPITYGCASDASTLKSVTYEDHAAGGTFGKMVVSLRHSDHCNASWSQVVISAGGTAHVTSAKAYMQAAPASTARTRTSAGTVYSNMRAGTTTACGDGNWNSGAVTITKCVTPPPSCSAATCNGKDPVLYGCAGDATTINTATYEDHAAGGTFSKMVVRLRYSHHCNASWSQVTASAGGTAHVSSVKAYMQGYQTSSYRIRYSAGTVYSKMRSGSAVGACGLGRWNGGAVAATRCATAG